jgi:ABC-2 type transport system permease protein
VRERLRVTGYRLRALARRDKRILLSYNFALAMRVISVAFGVFSFYFLGQLVGDAPEVARYDGGYFAFALVGLIVVSFSITCVSSFSVSINQAQADRTLELLLATSTGLGTLLAGTLIVPFLTISVQMSLFVLIGALLGIGITLAEIALAVPFLLLTCGTFAAVGIAAAAVVVMSKRGDPFAALAIELTNLLAGAVFPVALLPGVLQAVAHAIPATYGLRALRAVLLEDAGAAAVAGDALILLAFNVVMFPLALGLLRWALKVARVTGTLANA